MRLVVCMILCLSLMMPVSRSMAQEQALSSADAYFKADQFHKAATLYEQLFHADTTDVETAYRLAECYRRMFSYEKAQHYYGLVAQKQSQRFPLSVFYHALMLKHNQAYEQAIHAFNSFVEQFSRTDLSPFLVQAEKEKQGCYLALTAQSAESNTWFRRMEEPVNTPYNEFAPAILQPDSVLLITSSRIESTKGRINHRMGQGFTDQMLFARNSTGQWEHQRRKQNFDVTNSRWSDGSGCFNRQKDTYYFTSCREDGFCRIYVSRLGDGRWQEPVPLNRHVNYPDANTKHPALSYSGDTLFFVSDRPGGYGQTDIWMSISFGDDEWTAAVNLGENINTAFREISPFFLSHEQILVFASEGHENIGGMDLYWIETDRLPAASPQNPGPPFNSSRDDCYFILEEGYGFLSSNRYRSFDIYAFQKPEGLSAREFLQGTGPSSPITQQPLIFQEMISDAALAFPLQGAEDLLLRSSEEERLRNGGTRFILSSDVEAINMGRLKSGDAWENSEEPHSEEESSETVAGTPANSSILLTVHTHTFAEGRKGEIRGVVYAQPEDSVLGAVPLHLLTAEGTLAKITSTNARGEFRFVNLQAGVSYQIMVPLSAQQAGQMRIEHVVLQDYGEEIHAAKYEPIYFDFNQSALRKEARVVLKELADFWHEHPDIQIEINAFADSIGDVRYNLLLSEQRGQAAFAFLLSQGVDRSALVINAQGASTSLLSTDPLVSQQLNRRVEFEVIGQGIRYQPLYYTRILRPGISVQALLQQLDMQEETFRKINGLGNTAVQAYQPVRVKITEDESDAALFYDILER